MAIALVQAAGPASEFVGSSPISLAFGSNVTAGSLIVVGMGFYAGSIGSYTVADTLGNAYTLVSSYTYGDGTGAAIWYAVSAGSGANTVTVTPNTTISGVIGIAEFSGVSATPYDSQANTLSYGDGVSDSCTSGIVPIAGAGELLIGSFETTESGGFTVGTGFTSLVTGASGFGVRFFLEYQLGLGSNTAAVCTSNSGQYVKSCGASFIPGASGRISRSARLDGLGSAGQKCFNPDLSGV